VTSPWNLPCDPLEALSEGDPGPFEAFVPLGLASLAGFFRRKGASREEAEDLSQEVLMKLVQNATSYLSDGRFSAYVFRVGQNAWIDSRRRAGARPQLTGLEVGEGEDLRLVREPRDPGRAPGEVLELADEAAQVQAALSQLSSAHREVFELGVIQELPYPEISAALGIPVGTVKSRMFHALRALRDLLSTPEQVQHD
jgi:RNA polymerase sigma-70 factor (ECF subfamily)